MKSIKHFLLFTLFLSGNHLNAASAAAAPAKVPNISSKPYYDLTESEIDAAYTLFNLQPKTAFNSGQITDLYKRLALAAHPDRPGGSTQYFQAIKSAYDIIQKDQQNQKFWARQPRAGAGAAAAARAQQPSQWQDDEEDLNPLVSKDKKLNDFLSYFAKIKMPEDVFLEKDIDAPASQILKIGIKGEWFQEALQNLVARGVQEQDYEIAINQLIKSIRDNMVNTHGRKAFDYYFTGPQFQAVDFIPGVLEGLDYNQNDSIDKKLKKLLKVRLLSDFVLFDENGDQRVLAKKGQTVQQALESLSQNSDFIVHPFLNNSNARADLYSEFYDFLYRDIKQSPHGFLDRSRSNLGVLNKKQLSYFFPPVYFGFPGEPEPDWDRFIQSKYLRQIANNMSSGRLPLLGFNAGSSGAATSSAIGNRQERAMALERNFNSMQVEKIIEVLDVSGRRVTQRVPVRSASKVSDIIDILKVAKVQINVGG